MIEVRDLSTAYKNFKIKKMNLHIEKGKITFLLGKNGSGKTTLIKCLLNLKNYQGDILFDNQSIDKVLDKCGVVFSDGGLYHDLTGLQNMRYFDKYNTIFKKNSILNLEPKVLKQKVKSYSSGQKKKLFFNIAMLEDKQYIICDEISNGLDYDSLKLLKTFFRELRSKGKTILLTGHQFEFYNDIIDDIIVIADGKIKYYGDCKTLLDSFGIQVTVKVNDILIIDKIKDRFNVFNIDTDRLLLTFNTQEEFALFRREYIEYLEEIRVNDNKVGIIYEKFL